MKLKSVVDDLNLTGFLTSLDVKSPIAGNFTILGRTGFTTLTFVTLLSYSGQQNQTKPFINLQYTETFAQFTQEVLNYADKIYT